MISIIVPYRKRESHLRQFIPAIQTQLAREKITGEIVIVEQEEGKPFNRGKLLNVGALNCKYEHIILHDVDMLPIAPVSYQPLSGINHLAGRASQFAYRMPYAQYFGGVTMFEKTLFNKVNGFSNNFWGWGAEDDDLYRRCLAHKVNNLPYRFRSLSHSRSHIHENLQTNKKLLDSGTDQLNDGVNQCEYTIKSDSITIKTNFEVRHLIVSI